MRQLDRGKAEMCLYGLGMTEHVQGTEGVMTLINLALLTGNLGKPGADLSYARLELESINRPCPSENHPGTPVLHTVG